LAKTVGLAVDVAGIISKIAERYDLSLPSQIVMSHYDEDADTLYVHFKYPSESVDGKVVDQHGEIILGLNRKGQIVNMTVINALTHK
jgi:uncharacterized protein YuzE